MTAELAAALPALMLLLAVGLTAVSAVGTQLRCLAAARDAALTHARGVESVTAESVAAPAGAKVVISRDDDTARAEVSVTVRPLGGRLPGFTVSAVASAGLEPGVP